MHNKSLPACADITIYASMQDEIRNSSPITTQRTGMPQESVPGIVTGSSLSHCTYRPPELSFVVFMGWRRITLLAGEMAPNSELVGYKHISAVIGHTTGCNALIVQVSIFICLSSAPDH